MAGFIKNTTKEERVSLLSKRINFLKRKRDLIPETCIFQRDSYDQKISKLEKIREKINI